MVKPTCYEKVLESGEEMIDGVPENILWCHGIHQPAYDEMLGDDTEYYICGGFTQ